MPAKLRNVPAQEPPMPTPPSTPPAPGKTNEDHPALRKPDLSRRTFVATASAAALLALPQEEARAAIVRTDLGSLPPYGNGTLPPGVRSRSIANVNGMAVHILEAGFETPGRPAGLLLPGFPGPA